MDINFFTARIIMSNGQRNMRRQQEQTRVSMAFVGQVSAASSPAIAKLKGRARATNDPAYVPLASSHRAQSRRRRDPGRDLPRGTSGDSDPTQHYAMLQRNLLYTGGSPTESTGWTSLVAGLLCRAHSPQREAGGATRSAADKI